MISPPNTAEVTWNKRVTILVFTPWISFPDWSLMLSQVTHNLYLSIFFFKVVVKLPYFIKNKSNIIFKKHGLEKVQ